jgi:predicted nucleic acid-binding protein
MKLALDASVGFKTLVVEKDTDKARKLRDDFRVALLELIAPDIYPAEVTHSLTRAERQNRITQAEGIVLFKDLLKTLPQLHSSLLLLPRAYEISSAMRIGVFDCLYVALAEQESCDLVTADARLISNLQKQFPFIKDLASFP